ncbi:MAG: multicopper oxidase domain-containing protein [Methylocella sp.]
MLSRRSFLSGTLAIGATTRVHAQTGDDAPTVLRIERRDIEVNGKSASVFCIRQPDGTFGITTNIGKPFRVRVENHIDEPSLIHWHGLTPPWQQDGVPDISGPAIPPGGSAGYDFPLRRGGTYWMHSHYGFQEQLLLSAPLIIRDGGEISGEQDIVVELADFSFTLPEKIYADLQARQPAAMNIPGMAMAAMKSKPDLNDVPYDAFLANSRTLADPEVVKVEPGGRVRLRIINGSSMSNFHIDLGRLKGDLVAVDGHPIQPVQGRSSSRSPTRSGWTSSSPFPKWRPPIRCWPCWKASAGGPASCFLPGRDMLGAFPDWPARHRRRSLSAWSVL